MIVKLLLICLIAFLFIGVGLIVYEALIAPLHTDGEYRDIKDQ